MSFKEIDFHCRKGGRAAKVNSVVARVQASGTLRFSISDDVAALLGDAPAVRIMLGSGEHEGHIALIPAPYEKRRSFRLFRQKGGKQANVDVASYRVGVTGKNSRSVDLPFKAAATGIVIDVRPLSASPLSLVA